MWIKIQTDVYKALDSRNSLLNLCNCSELTESCLAQRLM
jgi:hypothetical protein